MLAVFIKNDETLDHRDPRLPFVVAEMSRALDDFYTVAHVIKVSNTNTLK